MTDRNHDDGQTLLSVLEELQLLISNARAIPMSASVMVNQVQALDLLAAARAVVPSEIHRADAVVSDVDRMRADAERSARTIIADAEERARQLASENSIVELARSQAAEIVTEARRKADQLAAGADEYCAQQLTHLERDLRAISAQTRAGLKTLNERMAARKAAEPRLPQHFSEGKVVGESEEKRNE